LEIGQTRILDHVNVPFRCAQCHKVGHVIEECKLVFQNIFEGKDRQYRGFVGSCKNPSPKKVDAKTSPTPPKEDGGMYCQGILLEKNLVQSNITIKDLNVPLVEGES
jgi:hypothetical protein